MTASPITAADLNECSNRLQRCRRYLDKLKLQSMVYEKLYATTVNKGQFKAVITIDNADFTSFKAPPAIDPIITEMVDTLALNGYDVNTLAIPSAMETTVIRLTITW